jgi:hypothetical protein
VINGSLPVPAGSIAVTSSWKSRLAWRRTIATVRSLFAGSTPRPS